MVKISRLLPEELGCEVNPKDYGFEAIEAGESAGGKEDVEEVDRLYREVNRITGIVIPEIEKYVARFYSE